MDGGRVALVALVAADDLVVEVLVAVLRSGTVSVPLAPVLVGRGEVLVWEGEALAVPVPVPVPVPEGEFVLPVGAGGLAVFCAAASDAKRTRALHESRTVRLIERFFCGAMVADSVVYFWDSKWTIQSEGRLVVGSRRRRRERGRRGAGACVVGGKNVRARKKGDRMD